MSCCVLPCFANKHVQILTSFIWHAETSTEATVPRMEASDAVQVAVCICNLALKLSIQKLLCFVNGLTGEEITLEMYIPSCVAATDCIR